MKKLRVGINGLGRIGRAIFRINLKNDMFDVVAVNDINPDIDNMAYLLKYDCTYGKLEQEINTEGDSIFIGKENSFKVYHHQKITDVPWDDHNVDIVIDSSGIKANLDLMKDDNSNVKKWIVTNAPNHEAVKTIIFGVNEDEFNPSEHKIVSSSICDTISLSPILKTIKQTHQIESGFLTTLHPWLSYQNLLDGPSVSWSQPGDINSHYALGRASTQNLIPKSTSAVLAAEKVFPNLTNRLQSFSYRTPTAIVSSAVLILMLDKDIEQKDLINRFYEAEKTQAHKVFRNSMEPLTSLDYTGDDHSVIIDHRWTKIENKRHLKMVYWYDNEWGYSNRVCDLAKFIASKI